MTDRDGFVGGDAAVVGWAGEQLSAVADDVGGAAQALRAALARAAGAAGHRAAAAALEGCGATWCSGLALVAVQVAAVAALASAGAEDLRRADS